MSYKYPWQKREEERKAAKKKKAGRIRHRTVKGAREDREYLKRRAAFLEKHPVCQCGREGCLGVATEIHHKRGRGVYLLVVKFFLAVCNSCHRWIETHPEEAKAAGYSEDRLT